jgi:hypothetical protein
MISEMTKLVSRLDWPSGSAVGVGLASDRGCKEEQLKLIRNDNNNNLGLCMN